MLRFNRGINSFGIALAPSNGTVNKLSSKNSPLGVSAVVCERCGAKATVTMPTSAHGHADRLQPVRCEQCNHGWFVPVTDGPVIFRRKLDRRAKARHE
jgi:hypothetical protein